VRTCLLVAVCGTSKLPNSILHHAQHFYSVLHVRLPSLSKISGDDDRNHCIKAVMHIKLETHTHTHQILLKGNSYECNGLNYRTRWLIGVNIFSKRVLCEYAFLCGIQVNLLQLQMHSFVAEISPALRNVRWHALLTELIMSRWMQCLAFISLSLEHVEKSFK